MSSLSALLALLDSRSFTSLWYWLGFAAVWSLASRNVLGIPSDVVMRARRDEAGRAMLLQWLVLVLPQWRIAPGMAMLLTALGCCAVVVLAGLGFAYGLEAAQALFLLVAPMLVVLALRIRLARGLVDVLASHPQQEAARLAARRILRHGWLVFALALVSIAVASFLAALWIARHPFGI